MTLWSHGLARSRDRLKPLNLHYHSIYYHQTRQGGYLLWRVSSHKAIWFLSHVQDYVKYWKCFISTTTVPLVTKLGIVVTYHKVLLPIKSHDLFDDLILLWWWHSAGRSQPLIRMTLQWGGLLRSLKWNTR